MSVRMFMLAIGGLLLGCRPETGLPNGAVILDASAIPQVLDQCSRQAPAKGEGSWSPTAADIAAFEAALPQALKQAEPREEWSQFPAQWRREYVGLVRAGRNLIYGNFGPIREGELIGEPPVIVCDGGPQYFGAEWDIQSRRITHLAFNGVA